MAVTIGYAAGITIVLVVLVEKAFGFRLGATGERAGMDHSCTASTATACST